MGQMGQHSITELSCHRHFAALAQYVERDLDVPPRFQAAGVEEQPLLGLVQTCDAQMIEHTTRCEVMHSAWR